MAKWMGEDFDKDLNVIARYNDSFQTADFALFTELFHDEIKQMCEFSFSHICRDDVEFTVEGEGPEFCDRIRAFLLHIGIEDLCLFDALTKRLQPGGMLIKAAFSQPVAVSVYYHRLTGLSSFPYPLSDETRKRLERFRKQLKKRSFFIGIDYKKGEPVHFSPFLLVGPALENFDQVLCDICRDVLGDGRYDALLSRWHGILSSPTRSDVYVSFVTDGSTIFPRVKIDYQSEPITAAYRFLKEQNLDLDSFTQMVRFASDCNVRNLFYLGLKLADTPSLKFYFKRYYFAHEDEAVLLAHFLERVIPAPRIQ